MFPRPSEVGGERLRPSDIVPVLTRGLESGEGDSGAELASGELLILISTSRG